MELAPGKKPKNIYWKNNLFHLEINGCFGLSHLLATIHQVQCARPHTEYCADTISCNPHHHHPIEVVSLSSFLLTKKLKLEEVECLGQGHTACEQQSAKNLGS